MRIQAYDNFSKYATVLLEHCPEDTTQIFIDYYTGQFGPKKDTVIVTPAANPQSGAFATTVSTATTAVQNLAAMLPLPYMNMNDRRDSVQKTFTRIVESVDKDPPPKYDIPQPRGAFSAFVNHPEEFVKFLEACVRAETLGEAERGEIYTTLFEMYLRNANDHPEQKDVWEAKAKELVEGRDVSRVLRLLTSSLTRNSSRLTHQTCSSCPIFSISATAQF